MNQLNSIIVEGNICKKPEIKEKNLSTFSIAVNRYYKKTEGEFEQETSYFDVEAWGSAFVKNVKENAEKGRGVRIVGRLKQSRWQDKDGKWQSRVTVVAEHIDFKPLAENKREGVPKKDKKSDERIFQDQEINEPMAHASGFDIF